MSDTANDLGILTAKLFDAKAAKTQINQELKLLNSEIEEIEVRLLLEMQRQKLVKIGDDEHGTVYISRQVAPKVVDWDALYQYIAQHQYFHLLERRASLKSYREMYEQGEEVPGIEPVVFDEVRTRKT